MIDFIKDHWAEVGIIYLGLHKFLVVIRDVLDKTPASDDNWFERLVTILGKISGYLFLGKRPNS